MEQYRLDELQAVFRQLIRKMQSEWTKYVEQGISGSQAIILETLERNGPQKVSDLAEVLDITSGAVTFLCDKLIAAGYAERYRSEDDRRVVFMKITEEGLKLLPILKQQRNSIIKTFFGGLSDQDIDHLIKVFNQVLHNIEKNN
jgi:DNA-binding MarR family transcriptional regulator